jgi:hypothetical protein
LSADIQLRPFALFAARKQINVLCLSLQISTFFVM